MAERVDAVVIGMGPGGEAVASRLADAGLRVVGIERSLVGGECPYWGCVPSKMMVRAAGLLAEARRVPQLAGTTSVTPDWSLVARRIRDVATDDWDDRVAVKRFEDRGGLFVRGDGRLEGPARVVVGERTFDATRAVVLATGSYPVVPPIPGLAGVPYWTNRDAVEAESVPGSLVVLGGGAIGVELGQVFARFGARVTFVEADQRLLGPEEPEAAALITDVLRREGVDVRTRATVVGVEHDDRGFEVTLDDGTTLRAERLLVATGRRAALGALGLATIGLDGEGRAVPVDPHLRVAPGIWAVGDITGHGAFTHVAAYEARIAADDILGRDPAPTEYHALPRVTFTDPEVGSVGLTRKAAAEEGLRVRVGVAQIPASARGWIHGVGNDGFVQLIEDSDRGVLVGATSVGPTGGEVLGLLTLAVHARVPTATLRHMIYAYPTFHRAVEDALDALD
jgi:pyruvate/2-oxoglutarate dehydrogenase complex dihydrolipoamide dehydrogenase (E3) component